MPQFPLAIVSSQGPIEFWARACRNASGRWMAGAGGINVCRPSYLGSSGAYTISQDITSAISNSISHCYVMIDVGAMTHCISFKT
jgi:hypothetical protein